MSSLIPLTTHTRYDNYRGATDSEIRRIRDEIKSVTLKADQVNGKLTGKLHWALKTNRRKVSHVVHVLGMSNGNI